MHGWGFLGVSVHFTHLGGILSDERYDCEVSGSFLATIGIPAASVD